MPFWLIAEVTHDFEDIRVHYIYPGANNCTNWLAIIGNFVVFNDHSPGLFMGISKFRDVVI